MRIELRMQPFLRGSLSQVQKEYLIQRCHLKEEDQLEIQIEIQPFEELIHLMPDLETILLDLMIKSVEIDFF